VTNSRPYWLGAAIAAIGAVWLWQGLSLPATARYAEVGPGMFPAIIGGVLIVLAGILTWQVHRGEKFEPQEAEDADADAAVSRPALVYAVAAAAIPLLTMRWVGFPVTAALSFLLVTRAFGSRRLLLDAAIGIALGTACWYGFSALGVRLGAFFPFLRLF
jgi:putative tricarboxylic transport membrane protein